MPYQRTCSRIRSRERRKTFSVIIQHPVPKCGEAKKYLKENGEREKGHAVFLSSSKISRASSKLHRSSTHSRSMSPFFISSNRLLARLWRWRTWLASLVWRKTMYTDTPQLINNIIICYLSHYLESYFIDIAYSAFINITIVLNCFISSNSLDSFFSLLLIQSPPKVFERQGQLLFLLYIWV